MVSDPCVSKVFLSCISGGAEAVPDGCSVVCDKLPQSADALVCLADMAAAPYVLLSQRCSPATLGQNMFQRMVSVACQTGADWLYSDRIMEREGGKEPYPTIDYQEGSIRDDFDFGQFVLVRTSCLKKWVETARGCGGLDYAGLYDLRLFASRHGGVRRVGEMLYTESEDDPRKSGERQFDYVDPKNRRVQEEMERAATRHLEKIGAMVDTSAIEDVDADAYPFETEASVVIPVLDRAKTVGDAVRSALGQETTFPFNVIVVDNHSTDGTAEVLDGFGSDGRLVRIVPERTDLGIGGCWNEAVADSRCGRFAVQLDSDDLYSSPHTLQKIVDTARRTRAAMVVGSYRMCDFRLNTLPPGLIDHKEWTDGNGPNNALRINGLGAPRAFYTPLLRMCPFPNTSYGEDYAMGLRFCRTHRIARIYEELYLCRRWDGNSDAALSHGKVNANNHYKDWIRTVEIMARRRNVAAALSAFFRRQLSVWPAAARRYGELSGVETKALECGGVRLLAQHNPARMVSTAADITDKGVAGRKCFLCGENRPAEQVVENLGGWDLLLNPFPIFKQHFTIASRAHRPQSVTDCFRDMCAFALEFAPATLFYNGPMCGASAPDHLHIQAAVGGCFPLKTALPRLMESAMVVCGECASNGVSLVPGYVCPVFVVSAPGVDECEALFGKLYAALPKGEGESEPMLNVLAWSSDGGVVALVIPRAKHRPGCYCAEGTARMMISPGAVDMAGLVILPRKEDYVNITAETAAAVIGEVGLGWPEATGVALELIGGACKVVKVGIACEKSIGMTLNGPFAFGDKSMSGRISVSHSGGKVSLSCHSEDVSEIVPCAEVDCVELVPMGGGCTFTVDNVEIGIDFHWHSTRRHTYQGKIVLKSVGGMVEAVNEVPMEEYLQSVVSSEMGGNSPTELVKAHAVISRSWLLSTMLGRRVKGGKGEGADGFHAPVGSNERIVWYDARKHNRYDVCADDHCQRYQGLDGITPEVRKAVEDTAGEILMFAGGVCDARFSKCCGGALEEFQCCWGDTPKPYLRSVGDNLGEDRPDLSVEEEAEKWVRSCPEAYCASPGREVLEASLKDYDKATTDFYRWSVEYSREELSSIVERKTGAGLGLIKKLIPIARGMSGRIWKLEIEGEKGSIVIGKELEIRRVLSETHLLSSAFVVDTVAGSDGGPSTFVFTGAGWGHGVGLCQIGAAAMAAGGVGYKDILAHYYKGAGVVKAY